MVEVDGMHKTAAQHVCPKSVDGVLGKVFVLRMRDESSQMRSTTEPRHTGGGLRGLDQVFRRGNFGFDVENQPVQQSRNCLRCVFVRNEDRLELGFTVGLLTNVRLLVVCAILKQIAAIHERIDAVVLRLIVVRDIRMVMALGTLQVAAKEETPDVSRQRIRFDLASQQPLCRSALIASFRRRS